MDNQEDNTENNDQAGEGISLSTFWQMSKVLMKKREEMKLNFNNKMSTSIWQNKNLKQK